MTDRAQLRNLALVVDDSPETLSLLTDALDKEGMTVMVALDGTSAIRIAERLIPDIVLLDAIMPGLDGFETCRRLREVAGLRDVPVIFMTGLSETAHIVKGLEAGGVDYVTKPIVIEEMLARIRVHIANARTAQSARAALDASGRYLMAVDESGRVLWMTPHAEVILNVTGERRPVTLPRPIQDWVMACSAGDLIRRRNGIIFLPTGAAPVQLSYVGRIGDNEVLFRLAPQASVDLPAHLFKPYKLTKREAEVLSWIVKGKSNRDVAEILGLSARTIDKHLEQIYTKLGVESRTAATVLVHALAGEISE